MSNFRTLQLLNSSERLYDFQFFQTVKYCCSCSRSGKRTREENRKFFQRDNHALSCTNVAVTQFKNAFDLVILVYGRKTQGIEKFEILFVNFDLVFRDGFCCSGQANGPNRLKTRVHICSFSFSAIREASRLNSQDVRLCVFSRLFSAVWFGSSKWRVKENICMRGITHTLTTVTIT